MRTIEFRGIEVTYDERCTLSWKWQKAVASQDPKRSIGAVEALLCGRDEEYADLLCDCIEVLPPNVVIHRLTGDGDKKLLVAPMWSADKKRVLNTIQKALRDRNVTQGSAWDSFAR